MLKNKTFIFLLCPTPQVWWYGWKRSNLAGYSLFVRLPAPAWWRSAPDQNPGLSLWSSCHHCDTHANTHTHTQTQRVTPQPWQKYVIFILICKYFGALHQSERETGDQIIMQNSLTAVKIRTHVIKDPPLPCHTHAVLFRTQWGGNAAHQGDIRVMTYVSGFERKCAESPSLMMVWFLMLAVCSGWSTYLR